MKEFLASRAEFLQRDSVVRSATRPSIRSPERVRRDEIRRDDSREPRCQRPCSTDQVDESPRRRPRSPAPTGSFWIERAARDRHPAADRGHRLDLLVVGGGYTACGPRCWRRSATPDRAWCCWRRETVGWAASGRNGGFCEASLTHGEENGPARWPKELADAGRASGTENLDAIESDRGRATASTPSSSAPASSPWRSSRTRSPWLRSGRGSGRVPRPHGASGRRWTPRPTSAGCGTADAHCPRRIRRSWPVGWLAPRADVGVEMFEQYPGHGLEPARAGLVTCGRPRHGRRPTESRSRTNVVPVPCCVGCGSCTVPVYDYVLMTEPLTAAQLAAIGWQEPAGHRRPRPTSSTTTGSPPTTGSCAAATTPSTTTAAGSARVRGSADDVRRARLALLHDVPAARGRAVHPPLGRRDRHLHAVLRVLRHRSRRPGRLRPRLHRARRRRRPASPPRSCSTCSRGRTRSGPQLEMVRSQAAALPARAGDLAGRASHPLRARPRRTTTEGRRGLFLKTLDAVGLGFDYVTAACR